MLQTMWDTNILILILHQPGFTWTRSSTRGILETLENTIAPMNIPQYLDWKRYPDIKTL